MSVAVSQSVATENLLGLLLIAQTLHQGLDIIPDH